MASVVMAWTRQIAENAPTEDDPSRKALTMKKDIHATDEMTFRIRCDASPTEVLRRFRAARAVRRKERIQEHALAVAVERGELSQKEAWAILSADTTGQRRVRVS